MIVRSAMLFNNRLPAGLCALREATAQGLPAKLAPPSVKRAKDPPRTIVLSVLPALTHSTVLVCKRTAAVSARAHLSSPTITSMSVTVSLVLLCSQLWLNWLS